MLTQQNVSKNNFNLDIQKIRDEFPILKQQVDGKPLVYLDNGATSQKPQCVIDRLNAYYSQQNSTVRRGVYSLSEKSTAMFDQARLKVSRFINAVSPREIVFTKGCTEAINLVARSYGGSQLRPGDEVLISALEHHANIVPWQMICREKGAILKIIPINEAGEIQLDEYEKLLNDKTKLVSINHISNVLGTINPIKQMVAMAHAHGVPVLVDGAQGAPHTVVDVQDLDCDFYTFSGHKIYGPTGVGVLYGKLKHLEEMPPYQFGGDMIETVSFELTTFAPPPSKFEAGTPPIAEVIALAESIAYVEKLGLENIEAYENELLKYATDQLLQIEGLKIIGTAAQKASLISFVLQEVHPHDVGTILDQEENISVRAGHHCAQPLMSFFQVSATTRASFAFYNTKEEIDILVRGIKKVMDIFK